MFIFQFDRPLLLEPLPMYCIVRMRHVNCNPIIIFVKMSKKGITLEPLIFYTNEYIIIHLTLYALFENILVDLSLKKLIFTKKLRLISYIYFFQISNFKIWYIQENF